MNCTPNSRAQFGAVGTLTASPRPVADRSSARLLTLELGTRTLGVVGLQSLARPGADLAAVTARVRALKIR
jgi:hypothetical protein